MAAGTPHALTRATLATPRRFVLAGATGGLVTLASAATALLVLTGTSAVAPTTVAVPPPLPAPAPVAGDPGVVVLPTPVGPRPPASRVAPTGQHRGGLLPGFLVRLADPVLLTVPARTAALPLAVAAVVPAVPSAAVPAPVRAAASRTAALRRADQPGSTGRSTAEQPSRRRHPEHAPHGKPAKRVTHAQHAVPAGHRKPGKHGFAVSQARWASRLESALSRAVHTARLD